jgi:trk system potassium uptake protein TrkA
MNVVIFGCGRTGAALALQLAREHEVTVIEQNPDAFRRLGARHSCRLIVGSGLDEDVLEKADLAKADAFFALTRGDNTNLMAAQIAKIRFRVKKICVRVADPNRAEAYRKAGLTCINTGAILSGMMVDWVLDRPYRPIDEYNVLIEEQRV